MACYHDTSAAVEPQIDSAPAHPEDCEWCGDPLSSVRRGCDVHVRSIAGELVRFTVHASGCQGELRGAMEGRRA